MAEKSKNVQLEQKTEDLSFLKSPLNLDKIHSLPDSLMEPGYRYRPFIFTYTHDPNRVHRKMSEGWQIVYSIGGELPSKGSAASSTVKPNAKPTPIIVPRASGHKAVWMRISLDKDKELQAEKAKNRKDRYQKLTGKANPMNQDLIIK